ncbi:MAG: glycosyltransferase family 4 protein [Lachnospiraceae bacterium]|nr:glycosyltransferase family 4 protein [Lachnospiraceae bacterium]
MKHIVFVIGHYKNGGVPMRATNLANEFGRRGYTVTILVTKEIGTEIFFDLHKNVELVSLTQFVAETCSNPIVMADLKKRTKKLHGYKRMRYVSRFFPKWDKKLENQIRSIRISDSLRRYLLLHPDVTLIPFGIAYYEETFYAAEGLHCKLIYAERNAPELELPKDIEKAENLLKILSQADGAVFQTLDEQVFYANYLKRNVAVIHNPIKANLPEPYCGRRRPVVVNYCRIAPQKNLKLLVDAFIKLHKEYPDYKLEIYGNAVEKSEELLCNELKDYVVSLGFEDAIHILPPAADVHRRVRDCAMFVSSSDFEGLSNSMIEAMAIGMPCVCTDCLGGGAREVIQHEVNGLLVPMKDVDALYQGIKRLIDEPDLAKRCSENAARIRNEMSVTKIADRWLEVIECV